MTAQPLIATQTAACRWLPLLLLPGGVGPTCRTVLAVTAARLDPRTG